MKTMRGRGEPDLHRRSGLAAVVVALVVAGAGLAGCGDADDEDAPRAAESSAVATSAPNVEGIVWGSCPPVVDGATRDPRLTCGKVRVPLDYGDPGGSMIEVAVSKLPTAKQGARRGVMVMNPGGPADSGLDMPGVLAGSLPASVLDGYDLIGFDPRGVFNSTPQSCGLEGVDIFSLFPYPAADGSIDGNVESGKAVARQCATKIDTLKHFTTANTARDVDRIRQALGEEKISYWGQSYGTYLGAVYLSLFADKTDRFVLEGNVDPTKVWQRSTALWSKGMADRFPDAAKVAAAENGTLGLGATADDVTKTYLALADRLDRTPAALPGTPLALNGSLLRGVTYGLLLHNQRLPVLAQFWKAVVDLADGKPTEADTAVLQQVFADGPAVPGLPADNKASMFLAITCGDSEWDHEVQDYAGRIAAERAAWPLTAGMPANVWACGFWQAPAESTVTVTDQGPRNVLLLQNRRDNATPWESGLGLRQSLGGRATFVGVDNGGHYVYNEGSACADKATVDFLTSGTLPDKDVDCTDATPKLK